MTPIMLSVAYSAKRTGLIPPIVSRPTARCISKFLVRMIVIVVPVEESRIPVLRQIHLIITARDLSLGQPIASTASAFATKHQNQLWRARCILALAGGPNSYLNRAWRESPSRKT
jgi:hypothetical protein